MAVAKLIAVLVLLQSSADSMGAAVRSSIIGGDDAPKGSWPSLVYLDIKTDSGKRKWHCSGTILNENWVMTAGRCWDDELWSRWDRTGVWVGVHELEKPAERYMQEEISDGKEGEGREGGLPFPHWICQPYVRPPPKPAVTNGSCQESEVKSTVRQKRALEDSDRPAEGLSKNKQKKRSRNPNKNFSPELKPKYLKCEQCGNPKGNKCVFNLCRGCCKKKAFKEVADCPSHGLRFKTKAEKLRAEEDKQEEQVQTEGSMMEAGKSSCTNGKEQTTA